MQLTDVADEIEKKIHDLEKMRKQIRKFAEEKAIAIAEYRHARATVIIRLRNGISYKLDEEVVEKPPVSIIESLTRGICWKEKLEETKATEIYKSAITAIESLKAELNGWQSIYRYLNEK